MAKERNSSLEMLRIISMLLIVTAHFSVHGIFPSPTVETFSLNYIILQFLGSYAYVGVNAFMLITGYFMITSEKSNYKKIGKLIVDILFYSIILLLICYFFKLLPLSKKDIIGSISPWGYYWFVTNYVFILLIVPFLNKTLVSLSSKKYLWLIAIIAAVTRVLPFLLQDHFSVKSGTIDYFVLFYIIGGYIRLHIKPTQHNNRNLIIALIMFALVAAIGLGVDFFALYTRNDEILSEFIHYRGIDSIPADVCSIFLFLYFNNLNLNSKLVNTVARYTLDVYLIHENRLIMNILWGGGYFLPILFWIPNLSYVQ